MAKSMTLQDLHDKLIAEMPDGALHAQEECPFCMEQSTSNTEETMSKTFSEDEVQALVTAAIAEATKELSTELADLKATQTVSEWEAKIAEATAASEATLEGVRAELDAKVIEAEAAKQAHDELVNLLETEDARKTEEAAAEARKEERVAAVHEAIPAFTEDHLNENAERWAKMDDEAFQSLVADYVSVAEKASSGSGLPTGGILTATRETASATGSGKTSAVRELLRLRDDGVDPRELIR